MKPLHSFAAAALLAVGSAAAGRMSVEVPSASAPVEVHFSPHGGCTEVVVALVGEAKTSIRLQAYSFTSPPIVDALVAAQKRGIDVRAILDKSDRGTAPAEELAASGANVSIDAKHPIAHNKIVIVDGSSVETGSFNMTRQAEKNAENCVVIRDSKIAQLYSANWEEHRAHAE